VVAVATGIAGTYVTQAEPSGGLATGFYVLLSFITLAASVVSISLGEGVGEEAWSEVWCYAYGGGA